MIKKIIALNLAMLISLSSLFAFSGTWEFRTLFSQTVGNGIITLTPLDTNIIKSIYFTDKSTDRNKTGVIKQAIVEILDPVSDKYVVNKNAEYSDSKNDRVFKLFLSKDSTNPSLTVFVTLDSPGIYWFSYAISMEAFYKSIITAPSKDSDSLNMLGIMQKVK